jgi:cytochrome d ubiquinol oxidase subunit II
LFVPFVVAYIWFTWRAMNKKQISEQDLAGDDMAY